MPAGAVLSGMKVRATLLHGMLFARDPGMPRWLKERVYPREKIAFRVANGRRGGRPRTGRERPCQHCRTPVYRRPSDPGKFCSLRCRDAARWRH